MTFENLFMISALSFLATGNQIRNALSPLLDCDSESVTHSDIR